MICKNCQQESIGKFCNNCGQKSSVQRINLKYLVHEVQNNFIQINRGFFFTIKELFIRPGHSIREFLEGKRISHYKPLAFLIITSTLYVLISYLTDKNTFVDDMLLGVKESMNERNQNTEHPFLKQVSIYQAYIPLLVLPLFAFASYIAFLKSKYNYFEHLVLNIYITGQQMIIYILLGFIFYKDNLLLMIPFLVGNIYSFWAFQQFFKKNGIGANIGLLILTYILFIIQFFIAIFILGYLVGKFG